MLPVLQRGALHPDEVVPEQWNDWRWQLRNMLRNADDFSRFANLTDAEVAGLARTRELFRTGATPYYASLMDAERSDCPIRRQALPALDELAFRDEEHRDPLGEDAHSPVPSIFHKYPDRCLLYVVDRCAIYCRHCNRRRIVGGEQPPKRNEIDEALEYIESQPRIRDVLISGGDPLLLSSKRLGEILGRLRRIKHVEIIRIGSRVPVVLPMRIDDALCQTLAEHHPVFVNTHFNHPAEITDLSRQACERLVNHGIPVGNQAVLLRGINSSAPTLRALMRSLIRMRVRPYYLFQGDTVLGTDHLRTSVESAIDLMDGLRGWMSGMAVPQLVIDAPGGGGKIPIGPDYLREIGESEVRLRNYRGLEVTYPQPREKDPHVSYDEVYFRGIAPDDDREGGE
ncbi:MAG: KamA family radical SAM protein [Myxococcales bacterium]|nr:KamA family radical SAM protein [Myxococcales bacterium]